MAQYIPDYNAIIWLAFDHTKGKEIGKYIPVLVLSSRLHNKQTGRLICCPVSTSIHGAATEAPVDNLDKPSVVAESLIQTL